MTDHAEQPISPEQLRAYARLFVNRTDAFMGLALAGHWVCHKRPLRGGYLEAALRGEVALGLYAVDGRGLSRWACLDLDDNARGARLWRVAEGLAEPRQALLEVSRRGFHLWLLVEPSPWFAVQRWAASRARAAGLTGIEVFPKGPGLNGVRAPLTRPPKDGQVYPLIDLATGELVTEPWRLIASRRPQPVPDDAPEEPADRGRVGERTDHRELVAEVEAYTRLRYYGPERAIGRCPFHDDHHPSFGVVGGFWRCFAGCGQGGLAAFRRLARRRGW